ncbi:hypothetical protein DRH27_01580 [Candidatus Falkowbacteria bacterium]|nr:MAG: hypothetical protein DRH27_01580 [Candidatus Falkowbacteria bacterium]
MKLYKYEPKMIKDLEGNDVECVFKGYVELQIPTYKERMTITKEIMVDGKSSEVEQGIKLIDLVEKHVKTVNLKCGELEIKTVDDLGYSKEGTELINNMSTIIIQGIPLGNG